MAAASKSGDRRLEHVFELVRREDFVPPGPWRIYLNGAYSDTPDADPMHLYQNVLVALDESKGINNGEPFLHAAWIGAVGPKSGDTVCHIGAGTGYYSAVLSMLVQPGGHVTAFEIADGLAARARKNLAPFTNVTVVHGDATTLPIPPSDLIYVNAGVIAPPKHWLQALQPGGQIIFPWRPAEHVGLALVIQRRNKGFQVKPLMTAWFIPCVGASALDACITAPDPTEAWSVRTAWFTSDRLPDSTAVAIYRDLWFSSGSVESIN